MLRSGDDKSHFGAGQSPATITILDKSALLCHLTPAAACR
jgi:hypothetical protein